MNHGYFQQMERMIQPAVAAAKRQMEVFQVIERIHGSNFAFASKEIETACRLMDRYRPAVQELAIMAPFLEAQIIIMESCLRHSTERTEMIPVQMSFDFDDDERDKCKGRIGFLMPNEAEPDGDVTEYDPNRRRIGF